MSRRRGNVTERGKGRWQIKFDVPGRDGKRQQRYATVKGTKADAQKELTRLLHASDKDELPDPTRITVEGYIRTWLDGAHDVSPKTLERYTELAERQIFPHLGSERLQKLKPEAIPTWHKTLLDGGLAPRTVGHAHRLLCQILDRASTNRAVARNVAALYSPPKVEDDEVQVLTPEQIPIVLAALEGHRLHPIVSLALASGLRRGELLGLQWGDVNLDAATLKVERSVEETKAGLRVKPPKTKKGKRQISLPGEAVAMLQAHKLEQMKTRLAIGLGKPGDNTPVFTDIEGRRISPHSISRAWRMACKTRKLPRLPFHSLRHTHVSILIRRGVDILTISRRLGHSKASITLDIYSHILPGADEAAALAMEGVLK